MKNKELEQPQEYKLNYGYKEIEEEDILTLGFTAINDMASFIYDIAEKDDNETVYVFAFNNPDEENNEVIVTHNINFIYDLVRNTHLTFDMCFIEDYYLFECRSYEEAYLLALDLKEVNKLCYTK